MTGTWRYVTPEFPERKGRTGGVMESSIFIWALSLIPSDIFPYVIPALACASLMIYAAHRIRPSTRLSRLNDALADATEILARAKSECLRDLLDLTDIEACLLQYAKQFGVKLSASKIQMSLLKARDASWETYLHKIRAISHSLDRCERQVRELRTSTLLIIEAEHQRKLAEHINESREILNTVLWSPTSISQLTGDHLKGIGEGLIIPQAAWSLIRRSTDSDSRGGVHPYFENNSVEVGDRRHQLIPDSLLAEKEKGSCTGSESKSAVADGKFTGNKDAVARSPVGPAFKMCLQSTSSAYQNATVQEVGVSLGLRESVKMEVERRHR
ncbi:hypothetical protein FB451DRAFT_1174217 [Mycena latifolia]|nr:hypothetical protein FB451DRAFT_1174217 [Mycena latifolia]